MTYVVIPVLAALSGLLLGALWVSITQHRLTRIRLDALAENWRTECDLLRTSAETERRMAAEERRELYSRIQAYDPYVNDVRPAPDFKEPSRPEEIQEGPRSYTEEELAQLKLLQQADGMIRDTRTDALFETVEDWRYWQADLKKRSLPEDVHPGTVREQGYEEAVHEAKLRRAAAKANAKS